MFMFLVRLFPPVLWPVVQFSSACSWKRSRWRRQTCWDCQCWTAQSDPWVWASEPTSLPSSCGTPGPEKEIKILSQNLVSCIMTLSSDLSAIVHKRFKFPESDVQLPEESILLSAHWVRHPNQGAGRQTFLKCNPDNPVRISFTFLVRKLFLFPPFGHI